MDKAADSIIGYKSPNSVVLCEDVFHHTLPLHSSSKSDRPEQQCYQLYTILFHRFYLKRHPRFQKVPESHALLKYFIGASKYHQNSAGHDSSP